MPWQYPLSSSSSPTGAAGGDLSGTYPNPTVKGTAVVSRDQIRRTASGVIAENYVPSFAGGVTAPSTQRIYGSLLGLKAGDIITGMMLRLDVAAAGTAPTRARFGLADAAGLMVILSADLGAATNWTVGAALFPFTAPYTVPTTAGYFSCFVVNGTWGTTQPLLANPVTGAGSSWAMAAAGAAATSFTWDAQGDLPAIGAALTVTSMVATRYMGVYGTLAP